MCEHTWRYRGLEFHDWEYRIGGGGSTRRYFDVYFCEKCLEVQMKYRGDLGQTSFNKPEPGATRIDDDLYSEWTKNNKPKWEYAYR